MYSTDWDASESVIICDLTVTLHIHASRNSSSFMPSAFFFLFALRKPERGTLGFGTSSETKCVTDRTPDLALPRIFTSSFVNYDYSCPYYTGTIHKGATCVRPSGIYTVTRYVFISYAKRREEKIQA